MCCGGGSAPPPTQTVTSTTVQKADPWSGQQPYLTFGFQEAQNLYNQPGPSFYPGYTYATPSPQTQAAMGLMEQRALSGSPITAAGQQEYLNTLMGANLYANPAYGLLQPYTAGFELPGSGLVAGAGYAPAPGMEYMQPVASGGFFGTNPAYSGLTGLAGGVNLPGQNLIAGAGAQGAQATQYMQPFAAGQFQLPGAGMVTGAGMQGAQGQGFVAPAAMGADIGTNPAYNYLNPIAGGQFTTAGKDIISQAAQAGPSAAQYFEPTAGGAYLDQGNPQLKAVIDSIYNTVTPQVQSQFAQAGRSGSGAEQEAMTRALGTAIAPYAFQAYESERGRQLEAARALQSGGEAALGRALSGGQALAGISQGDLAAQMGAARSVADIYGGDLARQLQAAGLFGQMGEQALGRQIGAGQTLANIGGTQAGIQLGAAGQLQGALEQALGRQIGAGGTLGQLGLGATQAQLGALGQLGGLYGQDISQMLQAAGMYQGAGEQALARQLQAGGQLADIGGREAALGQAAATQIGALYDTERARQLQAAMGAPQYAQSDYQDIAALGQVGQALEGQRQQEIADLMARYDFSQTIPFSDLAAYMGMIQGNYGGTTNISNTEPYIDPYRTQPDMFGNLLGLGQLGLGAYSAGLFGGTAAAAAPALFGATAAAAPAGISAAMLPSFLAFSSREYKHVAEPIDANRTLEAVKSLPIHRWRYRDMFADSDEHVGPMAEDWREAMGLGDGKTIHLVDAFGVALATIQALAAELDDVKAELRSLRDGRS